MFELAFEASGREAAIAAAAALAAGALAWRYGPRRPSTLAPRLAALALLALAAAKPVVVPFETVTRKPRLALWLDASAWMGIEEGGSSRLEKARRWIARARPAAEERARLDLHLLRDRLARSGPDEKPEAEGSLRLDRALDAPGSDAYDRVLLLSDGVGDLSEDLAGALERFGAPVDVLGVGRRRRARGITLRQVRSPDFVFLHEPFELRAEWEAASLAGRWVKARLYRGPRLVEEKAVGVTDDFQTFVTTFTARPEGLGRESYRVELEAPGLEAASQEFRTEVVRQKLRILYLAGKPSFEYGALRRFIKSDPSNELVSFVILRNQENVTPVPESELSLIPFPAQEIFVQRLHDFDLFIFQDFAHWRFGLPRAYLEAVRQFVRRGGGLLVIGGTNAFGSGGYKGSPIEDLLPVELPPSGASYVEGLFRPVPGTADHPLVALADARRWEELPPLDGRHHFGRLKPGAVALAEGPDGAPVFSAREFGEGRVFLSAVHSTWRWKLGAGLDWRVGAFYDRYWARVFDFLTGALDLKRVRFAAPPKDRPSARLHVFDESFRPLSGPGVEVRILREAEGGRWDPLDYRETRPGVFEASVGPGRHRLKGIVTYQGRAWGEDELELAWSPPGMRFVPQDEALLRRVAEATGGRYERLDGADPEKWAASLPEPRPVRRVKARRAVWTSGVWLWLAALLLIGEWYSRRRAGWP